jgi:hypothetical protein
MLLIVIICLHTPSPGMHSHVYLVRAYLVFILRATTLALHSLAPCCP